MTVATEKPRNGKKREGKAGKGITSKTATMIWLAKEKRLGCAVAEWTEPPQCEFKT